MKLIIRKVLIKPIPIINVINGKPWSDDFFNIMTAKTNEKTEPKSKALFTHISKILSNHKKNSPSIFDFKLSDILFSRTTFIA